MDHGFNDQELSDIMKEIEALEDDFETSSEDVHHVAKEDLSKYHEFRNKNNSTENIVEMGAPRSDAFSRNLSSDENKSLSLTSLLTTSMKLKFEGNHSLSLELEIGKKVVSLIVSELEINIEMEGGIKFSIPISDKAGHKKVG